MLRLDLLYTSGCSSPHLAKPLSVICNIMTTPRNKESFEDFCNDKIEGFSNYLNTVNEYRKNQFRIKNNFTEEELKLLEKHFEIAIILAISNLDNIVILKNLHNSRKNWEINFFVKKMFLNIYETLKSLDANSKLIIQNMCIDEVSKKEYFDLNRNIKTFKKLYGYDSEMNKIRNITAGHIHNKNFDLYFSTLAELNPHKSIEMGIEFMSINASFGQFLQKNLQQNIKTKK